MSDVRGAFEAWWPTVGQTIGKVAAWEAWKARGKWEREQAGKNSADTEGLGIAFWAVQVEKLICKHLGKPWQPSGMSTETLIEELASKANSAPDDWKKAVDNVAGYAHLYNSGAGIIHEIKAEHARLLADTKKSAVSDEVKDELIHAGKILSNVAYNLGQKAGYVLTDEDCQLIASQGRRFDDALSAYYTATGRKVDA